MRLLVRFLGFLFAAGTVVFLVGIAAAAGLIWHFSKDLPDYSQLQDYEPPVMTRVHAADGALLGEYSKERRLYLPIQAVPKLVINAFLAAEDKNFYEHGGIDYSGMARAAVLYAQNYGSNRRPQGASTITQQVAKNFLLTNEVSFTRKIKEALLAMRIERAYSKDKILELYLNEIYLGLGAYGIAAASLVYFDKSVNELTVAEASYLAALPKAPAALHPVRNHDRAIERRNYVIDRLLENGWIKQADADKARKDPLDRHQPHQWRAHLRRRIFCRGSPPRHLRALRREEAVRRRVVGAHHARSENSGDGAQDHGRRPRQLRRSAGLARLRSASSIFQATGASSSPTSNRCRTSRHGGWRWCWRPAINRRGLVSSPGRELGGAVSKDRQTGIITLDGVRWAKPAAGPAKGKTPTAVSQVLSPGDVIYADPLIQGRQSGRRPVPAAPVAGSFRRHGGDGSLDRPRAGDGRRLLVRPEPVQPRDAGLPAAGLVVQADRLFLGARQRLYAVDRRGRRADRNRPGAGRRRLASGELFAPANTRARPRCATRCGCRSTP